MNKKELNKLKKIILGDEKAIFRMMIDKFDGEIVETDLENYFFIKGNIPLCFVAHIDTVRTKKDKMNLKIENNIITNSGGILGADDRAGVYGLFKIYESLLDDREIPSFLFTNYEEVGGVGVKSFIDTYNKLENVNLFIELDRRGTDEYVTYVDVSKEVENYIESFGFIPSVGSYSDIADLAEHYLIPAVNISIGYYSQHTNKERLVIDAMNMNIQRCIDMAHNPIEELYPINLDNLWSRWGYGSYAGEAHIYDDYGYSRYREIKACPTERNILEEIEMQLNDTNFTNSLGLCVQCGSAWWDCQCKEANMFELVKFWLHQNIQEYEDYESFGEYFAMYEFTEALFESYGVDTVFSNWLYENDDIYQAVYEDFIRDTYTFNDNSEDDITPTKLESELVDIITKIEQMLIKENYVKDFIFCKNCGFEWVNCNCENKFIFNRVNNFLKVTVEKMDCPPRVIYYQFIQEVINTYMLDNFVLLDFLENNNLHFKSALLEYKSKNKKL